MQNIAIGLTSWNSYRVNLNPSIGSNYIVTLLVMFLTVTAWMFCLLWQPSTAVKLSSAKPFLFRSPLLSVGPVTFGLVVNLSGWQIIDKYFHSVRFRASNSMGTIDLNFRMCFVRILAEISGVLPDFFNCFILFLQGQYLNTIPFLQFLPNSLSLIDPALIPLWFESLSQSYPWGLSLLSQNFIFKNSLVSILLSLICLNERLMRSAFCVCTPINLLVAEPVFMKLYKYIMVFEPI
jgi:hypothetical protein